MFYHVEFWELWEWLEMFFSTSTKIKWSWNNLYTYFSYSANQQKFLMLICFLTATSMIFTHQNSNVDRVNIGLHDSIHQHKNLFIRNKYIFNDLNYTRSSNYTWECGITLNVQQTLTATNWLTQSWLYGTLQNFGVFFHLISGTQINVLVTDAHNQATQN